MTQGKTPFRFDLEAAVDALRAGQDLNGKDGILTPLIKHLTEAAPEAEPEVHLEADPQANRKNGHTRKTIKTPSGDFGLATPRDRAGRFEPQLVKKHQRYLTDELERKILSLFAQGMSYQQIQDHVQEMYSLSVSDGTITGITDKLLAVAGIEKLAGTTAGGGVSDCLAGCHPL